MNSLCADSCTNMDFSKASQESCLSITCGRTENRATRYWKDLLRQQGFVAIIISVRWWNKSQWSSSHFWISVNTVTFKAMLNVLRGSDKQISHKIWPTWIKIYNLSNSVLQSPFPSPFFINPLAFFCWQCKMTKMHRHGVSALTFPAAFLPVPQVSKNVDPNLYPDLFWLQQFSRCRQWKVQFLTNASDAEALRVQSLVFEGSGAAHNRDCTGFSS